MKKILALILAVITLLSAGVVVTFAEDSEEAVKPVLHYDFEGENDYLKNKVDTTKAALVNNNHTKPVTFDQYNGVVKGTSDTGQRLKLAKADIPSCLTGTPQNGYTLFVRFKLEGATSNTSGTKYYTVCDMRDTTANTGSRPLAIQYQDTATGTDGVLVAISSVANKASAKFFVCAYSFDDINERYVNLALVVAKNSSNKYAASVYLSADLPEGVDEWTCAKENWTIGDDIAPVNDGKDLLLLGSQIGVVIDDFRVYDQALNKEGIASIITDGSFAHVVDKKGAQTAIDTEAGTYNIRFVGSIDSLNYENVGIEITPAYGSDKYSTLTYTSDKAYKAVYADGELVTSLSMYCSYFTAFTVSGVPLGASASFEVRFFAKLGTKTYYSEWTTVTVGADGNIVS